MLIFGLCKSCWCLKCLVSCFKYFHLKHTSRSLAPLCAVSLETQPLMESRDRKSSLCCAQNHVALTQCHKKSLWCVGCVLVGGHHCKIHTMLLKSAHNCMCSCCSYCTSKQNPHSNEKKTPNYYNLCIFHPFSRHKAIYNIIQYFRKTRHFKVYENILLHQIYSGKLYPSAPAP